MATFGCLDELYEAKIQCTACALRSGCSQVVPAIGQRHRPRLMIIGEAPGGDEDIAGEPFVGQAGQVLRDAIRETKILNKGNTLITNVLGCRPPKNQFPKDDCPDICTLKWLEKEIELAQPDRILLLGSQPLWFVARMKGITSHRGKWYRIRGIRTMATFHPSYVMRTDREGKTQIRRQFEGDIEEMANEVRELEEQAQSQEK